MLEGKVAIVTGASRGIGAAIAKKLGKLNATVIVNYQGSVDKANQVCEEIKANGGVAEAIQCDVSNFEACQEFMKDIQKKYGRIDILVNNAGITRDGLLMAMSEEDFDKVIDTNLKGCFNCIRFASRFMLKQKYGKIVNIASISGVLGNAGQANYSASKAGVIGLTKSAAREFAAKNIHVNAVAPGFIATEMTDVLPDNVKEAAVSSIPMKRFGEASEVAELVGFLVSPASDYITGQVICIDGGM